MKAFMICMVSLIYKDIGLTKFSAIKHGLSWGGGVVVIPPIKVLFNINNVEQWQYCLKIG